MINQMIDIVHECGSIMLEATDIQRKTHQKEGKGNFVTEYDSKVQAVLKEKLLALLPKAVFFGEEDDADKADISRGYAFIVDPIDGTANFTRGLDHSCISVALTKDGYPIKAVIYNPYKQETYYAEKGKGCFLNGRQVFVSKETTMEKSLIAFGTSPYSKEISTEIFMLVDKIYKDCADVRRTASAALDLADVACGRIEAYFERRLKLWDYAAGMLLIREAGGEVFYYDGRQAADDQVADILAGNATIAGKILICYFAEK